MGIYLRGKSWYYDFVHKGQRYTASIGPVSRSVAKEELARKKAAVLETRLNPAKARQSPRFDVFTKEYLSWVQANKKPTTYLKAVGVLRHLTTTFGSMKLSALTAWQIEQYKKSRKDAGKAPATVNVELRFLKALLNKAIAWQHLTDNPSRTVKSLPQANERTRFLSTEEEARLLAACSPALRRVVEVGLLTGFRHNELLHLRSQDIDFTHATVSVAACYSKNNESRTLPMGERLQTLLTEAVHPPRTEPRALCTPSGTPWTSSAFSLAFRQAAQTAGIEDCTPHTLRHTFASRLVMAGVDLRTVQELLGHKDIKMTLRYAHLSPSHKRHAMTALEQFSGETPAHFHNTPLSPSSEGYPKASNM